MEPLRGSVGVVARVLEELGVSGKSRCFMTEITSSKIRQSICNAAGRRPTVAPISARRFDSVVSNHSANVMRGSACFNRSRDDRVPLPVPDNVADLRVTNDLGNFRAVVRPPSTDQLGSDVTAPCCRSSERHPCDDRVFAGGAGESVSVTKSIERVAPTAHPFGHSVA